MPERRRKYRWLWGIGILVLAVIVSVVVIIKMSESPNSLSNNSGDDILEIQSTSNIENSNTETPKKESVQQYSGEDPNDMDVLTGVVSYAGVNGSKIFIRANIDQYLSEGSCVLSLTKSGNIVYSETVPIVASVSTSICDGFEIPVQAVENEKLKIEIKMESNGKNGKMEGEIEI